MGHPGKPKSSSAPFKVHQVSLIGLLGACWWENEFRQSCLESRGNKDRQTNHPEMDSADPVLTHLTTNHSRPKLGTGQWGTESTRPELTKRVLLPLSFGEEVFFWLVWIYVYFFHFETESPYVTVATLELTM